MRRSATAALGARGGGPRDGDTHGAPVDDCSNARVAESFGVRLVGLRHEPCRNRLGAPFFRLATLRAVGARSSSTGGRHSEPSMPRSRRVYAVTPLVRFCASTADCRMRTGLVGHPLAPACQVKTDSQIGRTRCASRAGDISRRQAVYAIALVRAVDWRLNDAVMRRLSAPSGAETFTFQLRHKSRFDLPATRRSPRPSIDERR